ncbi:TPA: hypothetical protein ACRBSS_001623 [Streptococcus pyogenes]
MKNNLPYYYRTWFISILFLAAPFTLYISAVAAICLLARSRDEFPMLDQEEIEKIKQQASDIISDAEKQKKRSTTRI